MPGRKVGVVEFEKSGCVRAMSRAASPDAAPVVFVYTIGAALDMPSLRTGCLGLSGVLAP